MLLKSKKVFFPVIIVLILLGFSFYYVYETSLSMKAK